MVATKVEDVEIALPEDEQHHTIHIPLLLQAILNQILP